MISTRVYRPVAVVLTASVLVVGAGQAAGAVTAPAAPVTSAVLSADADYQVDRALATVVTRENIDTLLAAANEKGAAETARVLEDTRAALADYQSEKDALGAASVHSQDLIAIIKKIAKLAQPIVVAALRVGGPAAATILETIATLIKSIPGIGLGGVITDVVLKSIAVALRVGGPLLADIIEGIKIDGVSPDAAQDRITSHLRDYAGLQPDAAGAWGKVLALVATA